MSETKQRAKADPEIAAMRKIAKAIDQLDPGVAARVMIYFVDRWRRNTAPKTSIASVG